MKKILVLVIVTFSLTTFLANTVYAGWKENYRTKYSKKTLDPNSEKAKKIRNLANFDFNFPKWKKSAEERKALGIEPATSLSGSLMPWKLRKENQDEFKGYTTNISPARKNLPAEEKKVKTGNTLENYLKSIGEEVKTEIKEALRKK